MLSGRFHVPNLAQSLDNSSLSLYRILKSKGRNSWRENIDRKTSLFGPTHELLCVFGQDSRCTMGL